MPRPLKEEVELTEQQEWFLALLDRRFQAQEDKIREILKEMGPPSFTHEKMRQSKQSQEVQLVERPAPKSERSEAVESQSSITAKKKKKSLAMAAKVMGQEMKEPPVKAWVKSNLDGYMGLVVVVNLSLMMIMAQMVGQRADYALDLTEEAPGTSVEEKTHRSSTFGWNCNMGCKGYTNWSDMSQHAHTHVYFYINIRSWKTYNQDNCEEPRHHNL